MWITIASALLGVVALLMLRDAVFPVLYRLRARKHRLGTPRFVYDFPFGLRKTAEFKRAADEERLLRLLLELDSKSPERTSIRQTLFRWVVRTGDPENIKAILATKFNDFELRRPHMMEIFGPGIFTQDGQAWKHSRAMLRPQFSKDQISRIDSVSQHVDVLIDVIRSHEQQGKPVDMQYYFHLFTMDTATEFLFGESVESLRFGPDTRGSQVTDPKTGATVYSADFVDSYTWLNQYAFYGFLMNGLFPLLRVVMPQYKHHRQIAHSFLDHYAYKALAATADVSEKDEDPEASYIFSYELAKETRDPGVLRDQIFNILIAGRDTTASTLSYSIYYLAKYPEEFAKVRAEVIDQLPEGTDITYENLRRLQYTQYFIKEVLRLAPVVPLNLRWATRDTVLPSGGGPSGTDPIFVAKGMSVQYSVYTLHRDKSIYGPDANEFRPLRWAPENKNPDSPMYSWGYLPFNGGPRICLGQQFALTEITLTLVKLLRAFDTIEPAAGFPDSERPDRTTLTLQVGGAGVPVRMGSRGI